ncbi:unnamed protein product [Alopecurus aequalis]
MLHQTLIPSSCPSFPSVSASPSSSPLLGLFASNAKTTAAATTTAPALLRSSSAMPSYAHHHSSLDERTMDALKGSSRQEESAEDVAAAADAPAAWGFAERDGFSVEDLLDLEEFCEPDKDGADEPEEPPAAAKQDKSNDGSQQSVVSFEAVVPHAPPVPEIVDLPAHDVEELEWVSRIMDDSLSELPPQPAPPASMMASLAARPPQHRLLLQRPRPHDGAYRALPSLASDPLRTPTICALSTEALVPVKAKRSKRSRASAWSLSGTAYDSASSSSTTTTSSCSSSSASFSPYFLLDSPQLGASDLLEEYNLLTPPAKKSKHGKSSKHKAKKRGRKPKNLPLHPSMSTPAPTDRRCSHCGVQKTPQWRAGPEGAKTLCNACGVRYKSGRLLPEYRPACSPTYVSSVHSNSHRKVLEMRRKKEDGPLILTAAPAVASF